MRSARHRLRHVRTKPHIFVKGGLWFYLSALDNYAVAGDPDVGYNNREAKIFCFRRNNHL